MDVQSPSVLQNRHGLWGARPTVLDSPGSDRSGAGSFQPSACQKGSKDVPIKHENHRRAQANALTPPRGAHCMLARRDRPIRLRLQLQSHPSIRPAEQSRAEHDDRLVRGACLVPGRTRRPGLVRGQGLASSASPSRDPAGPPSRGHPGSHHHARGRWARASQQGSRRASRPCSRPRPPGSHCALTVTRVPTARAARPRSPWERRTPASVVYYWCVSVCVSSLQRSLLHRLPRALAQLPAALVPELDVAWGRCGVSDAALPVELLSFTVGWGWLVGAMSSARTSVDDVRGCMRTGTRTNYQGIKAYRIYRYWIL